MDINFQSNQVHGYTFTNTSPAEYDLNFQGYWSDWCTPEQVESIEKCIDRIEEELNRRNGNDGK